MKPRYWLTANCDWLRQKKAGGYSDREIANMVGCSMETVRTARLELGIPATQRSYQFNLNPVNPSKPFANDFEKIANEEYLRRGFSINKAHGFCKFDFLINGLRVEVKGCNQQKDGRFRIALCQRSLNREAFRLRCDVLHLIAVNDMTFHWLIPATEIPKVTMVELLNSKMKPNPRFKSYLNKWNLLKTEEAALA